VGPQQRLCRIEPNNRSACQEGASTMFLERTPDVIRVGFTLYPGGCARILPRLLPLANRLDEADSVEVRNSMT
jgi:hypothetical protein